MSSAEDGGAVVGRVLRQAGVTTVMSMAGGHVSAIFQGMKSEGISSVLFRDERAASFAAAAWGALTRTPGVCLVTAGPGLTNAVTGMAQAQRAGWPVVSISGCFETFARDMGGLQELDQAGLMDSVSKWSRTVPDARRIGEYTERALQAAMSPRHGHAHLSIPVDLLSQELPDRPPLRPAEGYLARGQSEPAPEVVQRIRDILWHAQQPVVIAGSGVWFSRGEDALLSFVERAGLPTYTHEEARGLVPDSHPCGIGPLLYGLSGATALASEADVALVIGCEPDWRLAYLRPPLLAPDAAIIQVDSSAEHLTGNFATAVSVQADEAATLVALAREMPAPGPGWDSWRSRLKKARDEHLEAVVARSRSLEARDTVHAVTLTEIVRDASLREDVNLVFDGGNTGKWGKLVIPATRPGQWNRTKGPFAAIGHGLPTAIARSISDPGHPCLLLTGDGAFGFHAVEIETAVSQGVNLTAVVAVDGAWGSVQEGQLKTYGDVEGTVLPRTRFDLVATALGASGYWITDAASLKAVLDEPFTGVRVICVSTETCFPPVQYPPGRYARN
jgi:thiamine pyrophosphate-dependent acetolactate synthase large subunit-like protein